jgi:hypothetical protein
MARSSLDFKKGFKEPSLWQGGFFSRNTSQEYELQDLNKLDIEDQFFS